MEGYETVQARPFENRFLLDKIPDYYERLKHSYDGRFYEQEVLGQYLELSAGRVYFAFEPGGERGGRGDCGEAAVVVGAGF